MSNLDEVDNFTNDSAMMIAFERSLESKRPDSLFKDPLASALAGTKGAKLSENFEAMCAVFEFPEWPEFHKQWTAVRTRFIDDRIEEHAPSFTQLVNLGAGMDTRPHRMTAYRSFTNGSYEVDMEVVQKGKVKIFSDLVSVPTAHCEVKNIDLDFLDADKSLATELGGCGFDASAPSLFLSEGLIMYLGAAGKVKLLADLSAAAACGSVLVLQYMDASKSKNNGEEARANALSEEEARKELGERGWGDFKFYAYGDEALNFGRFPNEKFGPSAAFSFCVCKKKS